MVNPRIEVFSGNRPDGLLVMTLVVSPANVNVCGVAFGFIGLSQIFQTPFVATFEMFGRRRPYFFWNSNGANSCRLRRQVCHS